MVFYKGDIVECVNCTMGKNGDASCAAGKVHSEGNYACFNGRPIGNKPAKKQSKWKNVRCEADGKKFDSKHEKDRYMQLKMLQNAGEISNLRVKPRYELIVNKVKICERGFYPDFSYEQDGKTVIEDTKSKATVTDVYKMKRQLLKALYGLEIVEVFNR